MFALLITLSATAFAQDAAPDANSLIASLPDAPIASITLPDSITLITAEHHLVTYVLTDGVWVLNSDQLNTEAVGLFTAQGQVWVESVKHSATPLGQTMATAPNPVLAPVPSQTLNTSRHSTGGTTLVGSVITASVGEVVIDIGSDAGLKPGASIKIMGQRTVMIPTVDNTTAQTSILTEVGHGWVSAADDDKALVLLSRGSRANVSDHAEVVAEGVKRVSLAPERMGGVREFGVKIRPFLALDNVGVGFINESWMTWNYDSPWYTEVRLSPLGLGWSADGNVLSVAALGTAGFDSRWFRVGLGAGWSMLNNDASNYGYSQDYAMAQSEGGSFGQAIEFVDVTNAPSIAQFVRLGAKDGLNISVRNTFILTPSYEYNWNTDDCPEFTVEGEPYNDWNECAYYDTEDAGSEFVFGGLSMRMSVPTGPRTNLIMDWGTGRSGASWFEAGVDVWVRGNGDVGSLAIEAAAGFGSLVARPNDEYLNLYGPMVSGGARWRF